MSIEIITPVFERPPDQPAPACPPSDAEGWDELRSLSVNTLREMGLMPWNDPAKPDDGDPVLLRTHTLMLLPGEWYPHVPEGFEVVTIAGKRERFEQHVTDDDIRYGCLAFGIAVPFTDG